MTLVIMSCKKVYEGAKPIDLGILSTQTAINKITPSLTTGNITIEYAVTPGAKYSLQVVPFGGEEPVKTFGFTANDNIVTKNYDLSSLKNGDYTLVFIDVKGTEIKQSITIKK